MLFKYTGIPPEMTEGKWYNIKEVDESRTQAQNRLLWSAIYPQVKKAHECLGIKYSIDTIHEAFKLIYIGKKKEWNKMAKKWNIIEPSTTKLSIKEFTQYIRDIEEYCMDKLNYTLDLRDLNELKYYDTLINKQ